MPSAAALLDQLGRPGAIGLGAALHSPSDVARIATGIPALDAAIGGGLPRGRATEIAGPPSAGRTGLVCRIASTATTRGETIAWVDVEDALDPGDAEGAGIVLDRVLWVRPRTPLESLRAAEMLLDAGGFGLVILDLGSQPTHGRTNPWPRLTHAAERTRSALLVTGTVRRAGTFTALGIELRDRRALWSGTAERSRLLDGLEAHLTVTRSRVGYPGKTVLVQHRACA